MCVRKVGNLLITSFFIVRLQEIYRVCFSVVLACMDYALKGEIVVGKLERTIGTPYCFESVEVDSFVFNVVYLERAKCKEF